MDKTHKGLYTASSILVAISLYLSIKISYSVPQFASMFMSFGAEIPNDAKIVLQYHYFGLALPLISLFALIYIFKANTSKSSKKAVYLLCLFTFILTIIWQSYTVEVLYTHIYQMGEQ